MTAAAIKNKTLRESNVRRTGKPSFGIELASNLEIKTIKQKTGKARIFAHMPEVPETRAIPSVTKLPVT